jgi:lipopolysaccharide transport system ATP-binding protein
MMSTAIEVDHLTKIYRLYHSPKDRLRELVSLNGRKFHHAFHALNDVSFKVEKGETVGIIGQNGSGKSTLLKLICGVTRPTSGSVKVNGRVSSLLELGAGFHPEFTGRDNVYMNGALTGFSREEMDHRLPDIEAFADIGEFIDQPVKNYSSGMLVRLAFAAAINVDPDILVVDEALSVGDMFFQAKCMLRMKKIIDNGVTVLFVSHDMGTIKGLCQKSVYLEKGQLADFGKASNVVGNYVRRMHLQMNHELKAQFENTAKMGENDRDDSTPSQSENSRNVSEIVVSTDHEGVFPDSVTRYGDGRVRILDVKLLDGQRRPTKELTLREDFIIQVSVRFEKTLSTFAVGYSIRDLKGLALVGTVTTCNGIEMPSVQAGDVYVFEIKGSNRLTRGVYTVSIAVELPIVLNKQHIFLDVLENAIVFKSNFPIDPRNWFPASVLVPVEFDYLKV